MQAEWWDHHHYIVVGMEAAQYGMLLDQQDHTCHEAFLNHVVSSCRSQDTAESVLMGNIMCPGAATYWAVYVVS